MIVPKQESLDYHAQIRSLNYNERIKVRALFLSHDRDLYVAFLRVLNLRSVIIVNGSPQIAQHPAC